MTVEWETFPPLSSDTAKFQQFLQLGDANRILHARLSDPAKEREDDAGRLENSWIQYKKPPKPIQMTNNNGWSRVDFCPRA